MPRLARGLEAVLAFGILAIAYGSSLESVAFHRDESNRIASSGTFEEFVGGRFFSEAWGESYWTLTQPPLSRYAIGVGRRLGGFGPEAHAAPFDPALDPAANAAAGRMPSAVLLWWSRLPMAVLAAASIAVIFVLLHAWRGRATAWCWVAFTVANTYLLLQLRRALGEAPLLFFVVLAIVCAHGALRASRSPDAPGRWRALAWLTLVGVCTGLAGAAKLNGLSAALGGLLVAVIAATAAGASRRAQLVLAGAGSIAVLAGIGAGFVGVNPYLWPAPTTHTLHMFEHRLEETRRFESEYPDSRIVGLPRRIKVMTARLLHYYAPLDVSRRPWVGVSVHLTLFATGLLITLAGAFRWVRGDPSSTVPLSVLLVGGAVAAPSLLTPLDWDRYYLLPVCFATLVMAVGAGWMLTRALDVRPGRRYLALSHSRRSSP